MAPPPYTGERTPSRAPGAVRTVWRKEKNPCPCRGIEAEIVKPTRTCALHSLHKTTAQRVAMGSGKMIDGGNTAKSACCMSAQDGATNFV